MPRNPLSPRTWLPLLLAFLPAVVGCPKWYRQDADRVAELIIEKQQRNALGRTEPINIVPPADLLRRRLLVDQALPRSGASSLGADALPHIRPWPEKDYPRSEPSNAPTADLPIPEDQPLRISLTDALQIAARNNRDFQSRKEDIFRAALDLDLESNEFRTTFIGTLASTITRDFSSTPFETGLENNAELEGRRKLTTGAEFTARIAVDLVKLLTQPRHESLGLVADFSVAIPLLRGSGIHIVTEPLTQAQRNVVYAIYSFERYKRTLAVDVARAYLGVLQQLDQLQNAEDNYRSLLLSSRRARRLAQAGRLPGIQVDQALQDELRARERWIVARQSYERQLDSLKFTLGLPTDAAIELDRTELDRLLSSARRVIQDVQTEPSTEKTTAVPPADAEVTLQPATREGGGPLEMDPTEAIVLALQNRMDLRVALGQVYDAQRNVIVTADALGAGLTLTGTATTGSSRSLGSVDQENARLRLPRGVYSAGLLLDLPLERTAERNAYRDSYIQLQRAVRNVQDLEDSVKLEIRNALRELMQARESTIIQARAVELARRRVRSTELFLQAGRAEIRDLLESQNAFVNAQDALTAALVNYRVTELQLQKDMGVLNVGPDGLWKEFRPVQPEDSGDLSDAQNVQ